MLLLEDEVLLRKRLLGFLENAGAEVTAVNAVAAARQALESTTFDAAVIDVNLPDGRGTDLLRDKLFPPTTCVIVMTAEGGVAGAVEAVRAGAADYLVKPFDPEELPVRLAQARRNRQVRRVDEFRREQESDDDTEQDFEHAPTQIFRTSTSSLTAAADFWMAARSGSVSLISQIFSTPLAPSCAGTPT